MVVIPLQSGSTGNSVYVEMGGVRLLFDAGISGKQAEQRLAATGREIRRVDGLFVSHDHSDHARCMGIYHRKFGIPVYASKGTARGARNARFDIGMISDLRCFEPGTAVTVGDVKIESVPTPHDATEGVVFVVDDGRHRLGIMTDLGHVFDGLTETIGSLDAVVLESNYDPLMLANSTYPFWLIERIEGPSGHISNEQAATLLHSAKSRLLWACLGHLSEENNDPDIALETHRDILGPELPLYVASRYRAIEPIET